MQDSFLTISGKSEGFYKEKGSKFLAFAFPIKSEENIKSELEALRKEYYDARHHCYAYAHGNSGEHTRANDDGEPNHSAGDPILGQIRSRELTNVLVVVIRYFGGTKLGVSGLINAYKTAASEALDNTKIVKKQITQSFQFSFPYEEMNTVMGMVKELDLQMVHQAFENECMLKVEVVISKIQILLSKVDLLQKTGSAIKLMN